MGLNQPLPAQYRQRLTGIVAGCCETGMRFGEQVARDMIAVRDRS